MTPTPEELEKAFAVYFDEIERCRRAGAYWALLHVVVALPDICAALESENGWPHPRSTSPGAPATAPRTAS
jgi:hypothetical protein